MRKLSQLHKQETEQFIKAQRSSSQSKLYANDLLKLKKPLFNDYLHHLKLFAGSSPRKQKPNICSKGLKKQENQKNKIQNQKQKQFEKLKAKYSLDKKDKNVSYYYCQKNQLLSLKEFIILMEESKRKAQKESKYNERLQQKIIAEQLNRNLQETSKNFVNMRLTSNYARNFKKRDNLDPKYHTAFNRSTNNGNIAWNNSALKSSMSQSHTNFKSWQKNIY